MVPILHPFYKSDSRRIQKIHSVTLKETHEQQLHAYPQILHSQDPNKYRQTSGKWRINCSVSYAFKTTFSDEIMVMESKGNNLFADQTMEGSSISKMPEGSTDQKSHIPAHSVNH